MFTQWRVIGDMVGNIFIMVRILHITVVGTIGNVSYSDVCNDFSSLIK